MKPNQRVLFLLHLPPPVHGSSIVGLNIRNSATINGSFQCSYLNLLASKRVTETGKVSFGKIFGFLGTWIQLLKLLIFERPKLCYLALTVSGAALYKDLILIALLKIFSVKRLYHLHNKGVRLYKNSAVHKIVYRFVFKDADVVVLSPHLYADVQDFVPVSKLHVCANGVEDESNFMKEHRNPREPAIESRAVNILFLSNLIESKGVFVLLEALALLKQKELLYNCVFIGSEGSISSSQFNERRTELKLDGLVSYEGRKYGEEKKRAFLTADIFAFPTYYGYECFPLVLLEAMSYSLPIISTFEGGIQDIVADGITGLLVQQKDVNSLANALEVLIRNPQLRSEMGKAGRMKYEEEFTLEKFEDRLLGILKNVIEKK